MEGSKSDSPLHSVTSPLHPMAPPMHPVTSSMTNNSIPSLPVTKIPAIPPPGSSTRLAQLNRPPLEKASSMPEKDPISTPPAIPAIGTPPHSAFFNNNTSRNSSLDKSSSIDKSNGSKDALNGGRDSRPPLPTYEEAIERSKVADKRVERTKKSNSEDLADSQSGSKDKVDSISSDRSRGVKDKERDSPWSTHGAHKDWNSCGSADGILMVTDENNVPQIDVAITPPQSPAKEPLQHVAHSRRPFGLRTPTLKRFPSLKLRQRFGSLRRRAPEREREREPESQTEAEINPTITITVDDDADSIMSDYLSPDKNYRKDKKINFIGDDISLYGTPKEELSPLKEQEPFVPKTPTHTSYLKDQIISFFQPSDNKLAMKLFGNKNALMKEKMRQKAAGNWVIHPCSNFR